MHSTSVDRAVTDILCKRAAVAPALPSRDHRSANEGRSTQPGGCPMRLLSHGSDVPASMQPPAATRSAAAAAKAAATPRFMASSRFVVRNGMQEQVREAFRNRPHAVDTAAGFCRMEVLCPLDSPEEFWLMTWWTDEASFAAWHYSHLYRESHAGIPKGLKLVAGSVQIRRLELIAQ